MLKALHVYRTYFPDPPGGLQEAIRQICLGTKAFGVESRVFALSPQPVPIEINRPEALVVRARSWWAPASCDLGSIESLRRFKEAARFADVIHFHFPWPFADVLNLLGGVDKPKVMTYHSDIVRQRLLGILYGPLMRHTLGSMDAVVATSPAYAETSLVLATCVAPERLRVIPLGIEDNLSGNERLHDAAGVMNRLGLLGRPYVLALGVLRYYKGLHTLVAAAKGIEGSIVIAGSGPEGENLRAQVTELGVENVIFAGQVSDEEKATLIANCRALVLPSQVRSEAFGMVLIEASIHSKPMVCCEIGSGTSFVNRHGETGFVVPPERPAELAGALNRLLGDPVLAETMGRAARARYERMFSGPALGKAYDALYREVLGQRQRIGT